MGQLIFILLAIIGVSQAQTVQYIGAPTTTVISRGNFRTDSIFYLPKRSKAPTDTAALRYQISDSSLYAWTGSQWRKVGADADTLVYSTRAWRQKGDDSLAARINLKVNISDTASMLTPYLRKGDTASMLSPYYRSATASAALALKLNISDTSSMLANYVRHAGYGLTKSGQSFLVDTLNIATRAWRQKGLDSLAALEVSGSGTTNYVPKFTAGSTIGNSQIFDNGTNVGIGTGTPLAKLHIGNGSQSATNGASTKAQIMDGNSGGRAALLTLATSSGSTVVEGQYESDASSADLRIIMGSTTNHPVTMRTNNTERLRIFANGRVFVGASPTDAGYQLDINGTLRSVNGANFATTSGNVGIGTTSPLRKVVSEVIAANDFNFAATSASLGTVGNWVGYLYGFAGNTYQKGATFFESIDGNARGKFHIAMNDAATSANVTLADARLTVTSAGNVGIGTASPSEKLSVSGSSDVKAEIATTSSGANANAAFRLKSATEGTYLFQTGNAVSGGLRIYDEVGGATRLLINSAGELLINTTTDAGDYKLQVVGNARIGTGKLDIASNTTFGIGVARSGTSEVAGQIYNSNGILYLGAESSTGGQIFSGSSAYAAVIGSGAAYPLQFAANNITRATLTTNGNFMIGFPTDTYFYRLQVNGSIFSNNQIIAQNAAAQLNIDSSTNISPLYISNQSLTGSSAQGLFYGSTTWNTTGNPSLIDLAITNTASGSDANYIKISDGSNIFRVTKAAEVVTAAPTGGSIRKWKLGEAATVSPTSPNRTIRVEIDGTVYYLHAKTTND